jgi:hypothetical protein
MAYNPATGNVVLFGGLGSSGYLGDTWIFNGTTWTQLAPATSPSARHGASMVYDPATGDMVLFGGLGSSGYLSDTWTFNGTTWTLLSPAARPPARDYASMAYDSATRNVVLFGGLGSSGALGDTWTFDGATWTQLYPATSPSARHGASMAYDPATANVVLFGGLGSSDDYLGDTWTFKGTTWTLLSRAASPPARDYASMAYDAATANMILFGGDGSSALLGDTWTWIYPATPTAMWLQATPVASPSVRCDASMAYDPSMGAMFLFGGNGSSGDLSDTWTFDATTWTQLSPATSPSARRGASMVYDPAMGDIVLFGGDGSTSALGDTWIFKGTTWTQLSLPTNPSARDYAPMAYDPTTGDVVLFGGLGSSGALGDTWTFDGTTWTQLYPATRPSARRGASMAYDQTTGDVVLFGGLGGSGALGDTWTFNGTTWTRLSPATSPSARSDASAAYDPATASMVLFGGTGSSGDLSDTWTWGYPAMAATTWLQASPATSPPARQRASMAYDPATGKMVLFGGLHGYDTAFSDTWTFNGTTWTRLSPASGPPARSDASMDYDPATGDMVLYGGNNSGGYAQDDTWTFNGTTWTELSTASGLPADESGGVSMAYDPAMGDMVLFANGWSETWILAGNSWTRLSSATSPPATNAASMAYDPATGNMVLFDISGKWVSGKWIPLIGTWTFNGTTWTRLSPATSPPEVASMAYDPATGDMVLFGGARNGGGDFNDTWIFTGTTWTRLSPATSPSVRSDASMAYDPATGDMVLFGGAGSSGDFNSTWTSAQIIGVPSAPMEVTGTPGNKQVSVSWTAPSDNGGAVIDTYTASVVGDSSEFCIYTVATDSRNDCVITGLTNDRSYRFQVTAHNAAGNDAVSTASSSVVPFTVPGAPTKVTGTPDNKQVTVSWTAPNDNGRSIDTYTASVVGDSSEFCIYTVATDSGNDCVITGLTNGQSYRFQVTAHNVAGEGPASTASSPVTPATVPGAPTIGTATAGNASATLTWTAPSDNGGSAITGYVVTPYIGGAAQRTQTFTSTATSEIANRLTNGTAYTFRVAAFNTVGTGTKSAASNSVTLTKTTSKTAFVLSATKVTYGHEQVEHLSVTVSPQYSGTTPAGRVTVKESTTRLCVIKLSSAKGSCKLSARQLKPGTYHLVATYGGSTDFKGSTSAKETLTVIK